MNCTGDSYLPQFGLTIGIGVDSQGEGLQLVLEPDPVPLVIVDRLTNGHDKHLGLA